MSEKTSIISKVSKQGGRKQKLGPVLVNFEHGDVDPAAFETFKAGMSFTFPEERSGRKETSAEPKLKVFVKTDQLTYSNVTKSATESRSNPYTKTLIAIRNKRTNQVRLVETNCVTLSGVVRHPKSSNPFLIEESTKKKMLDKSSHDSEATIEHRTGIKRHLTREFGQAKGRRLAEQAERMKIDSTLKQEKLRHVADNIDPTLLMLPAQAAPKELTPPCNKKAKRVEDVYNLNEILTNDELDVLEEAAKALLEELNTVELIDESAKDGLFTEVFAGILKRQLQLGDARIAGAAIYMEAIFQYLNLRPAQLHAGLRSLAAFIPFGIKQKVFDTFVPNMLVSQENNDRAFCYALVVIFLVNNYSIDMKRLSSSVKIRAQQLKKLVQATGATIRTDSITRQSFVTLKIPLAKFDPAMTMNRAKKNN